MSRHKFVKALDLDEVLDDYDGGLGEDVEEELAPEDRGRHPVSLLFIMALKRDRKLAKRYQRSTPDSWSRFQHFR